MGNRSRLTNAGSVRTIQIHYTDHQCVRDGDQPSHGIAMISKYLHLLFTQWRIPSNSQSSQIPIRSELHYQDVESSCSVRIQQEQYCHQRYACYESWMEVCGENSQTQHCV